MASKRMEISEQIEDAVTPKKNIIAAIRELARLMPKSGHIDTVEHINQILEEE